MNRITTLMASMLLACLFTAGVAVAEGYAPQKVVYHINYDEPKAQAGALRNIQNHINAVGADKLELKVVLHGNGLSLLLEPDAAAATKLARGNADDAMQARIAGLKQQGVKFNICANTLKGKQVKLEDLYDAAQADVVPSGVAELGKLQGEGYAYIKP